MTLKVNSGTVATVTLDRPDVHNAFNDAMMDGIRDAFAALGADESVRVIVLRAEGKSFSAGADVNWMKRMVDYTFEENVEDSMHLVEMLQAIRFCPKPVIARVQGATYGGGVGLVAACDVAVALNSAIFCLSEVKLGIVPAVISPYVIEKIGVGFARRYCLTAERFDGAEARRINLVSEAAATETEMDQKIDGMVKAILANGPQAAAACKALLKEVPNFDWPRATTVTTKAIAERRISPEGQEGLKAFLEKRPPGWAKKPA